MQSSRDKNVCRSHLFWWLHFSVSLCMLFLNCKWSFPYALIMDRSTMSCLGKLKAVTTTGKVAGGEWGQCMFGDIHILEMLDSSLRFVILCRTISTNKVLYIHVLLMEEWHSWGNFLNKQVFARSITVCIIFNPSESIFPLLFYIIISSAEYWCYFLPKSMNRCYIINASYLAVWIGFLDNFFRPSSLCLEMFRSRTSHTNKSN